MKVLIDADIFRYQYGNVKMKHPFIAEEFVPANADYVCGLVDDAIKEIVKDTAAESYICVLSGKGNFRNEIAVQQPYKGNRDPNTDRPYHYDTIERHIIASHPCIVVDGMEADDWLGIEQRKDPLNSCIASRDKDLKTVYGWHYRFACGAAQPAIPIHWMTEVESEEFFWFQMLIGDNTDNIPGCGKKQLTMWGGKEVMRRKGVGEKTALKILDGLGSSQECYEAVRSEYAKVYEENFDEVMLEQARLLYIGQTPDNLFDWSWLKITMESESND